MGDWTGFLCAAVIVIVAALFLKLSKKVLTGICLIALIAWIVFYGLPAFM